LFCFSYKVTALPGQINTSSFRPIVSEATTVTTTTKTASTTPVAVTTTPPTTATTTKTTTTSKLTTATKSTDTTTTPKTTTTTTTFIKLSSANAGLTLPPSTYLTIFSTTNMPTSSTTRQTTAKSNFNLAQIPGSYRSLLSSWFYLIILNPAAKTLIILPIHIFSYERYISSYFKFKKSNYACIITLCNIHRVYSVTRVLNNNAGLIK
jgi:hypothetical protein